MASFSHKGTEISLVEHSGRFVATINGKRQLFPSLSAAKKKIDEAATEQETFEPFDALREAGYRDVAEEGSLVEVRIVRKQKAGRSRLDRAGHVDESGAAYTGRYDLLPNTPVARALWAKYRAAVESESVARQAREDAHADGE